MVNGVGLIRAISDWAPYGPDPRDPSVFLIDYTARSPHPTLFSPVNIAAEIYREIATHGPVTVMVSGGLDSQFSAFSARASGIDCRYVSFRYNDGLNDHDLDTDFYDRHGIEIEYRDFDIISFHENELLEWGHRYKTNSPHLLSHMRLASLITDSIPVFSGQPFTHQTGRLNEQTISLERYAEISGQKMVGYLINCDPHLFDAFCKLEVAHNPTNPYQEKIELYRRAGVDVSPQTDKLHGFEKLKEYYDDHPVPFAIRLQRSSGASQRPYDLLFRYSLNKYQTCATSGYRI